MKYFLCSLKYFVALCVLCVAIMCLNQVMGIATLTIEETFYVMFHTLRGSLLIVAIVVAAAFYPKFGFIGRRVEGDVVENRTQIINAMKDSGFELHREEDEVMYFRAKNPLRRFMMLYEDELKVSQYGQWIEVEGIRRGVAMVVYRLDSFIAMVKRNE